MKPTAKNSGPITRVLALLISLAVLPLSIGLTGCATSQQTEGERLEDLGTSSRVKAALGEDAQYKFGGVTVKTFDGSVRLRGVVQSGEQKDRAENLASRVEGVREVLNDITVRN